MKVKIFKSGSEFRAWLERNHDAVQEMWVGFYNQRSGKVSITYREALDEALCFGWIDGVRKSVNPTTYTVRFTPRKARSNWSVVNIKRMAELINLERVSPPGLAAFKKRPRNKPGYSYETRPQRLEADSLKQLKANPKAWDFFSAQAPWYRRTATYWVVSAKKEETRLRRLTILIADSASGRRIGVLTPKSKGPKQSS